jgi:hypothetical protein
MVISQFIPAIKRKFYGKKAAGGSQQQPKGLSALYHKIALRIAIYSKISIVDWRACQYGNGLKQNLPSNEGK